MSKKLVAACNKVIAFFARIKNQIAARFHQIVDTIMNALVIWLCRHYQDDVRYC